MAGPHEIHYGFLRTHLQVALKAGDVGASAESAPSSRNYNDANGGVELDFVQCPRDSGEQLVAEGVQLRRSVQRENRHSAAIVALQDTRSLFARGVHYNMQLPAKLMVQVVLMRRASPLARRRSSVSKIGPSSRSFVRAAVDGVTSLGVSTTTGESRRFH